MCFQASPTCCTNVLSVAQSGDRLLRCSHCGILDGHLSCKDLCPEAWVQRGWKSGEFGLLRGEKNGCDAKLTFGK